MKYENFEISGNTKSEAAYQNFPRNSKMLPRSGQMLPGSTQTKILSELPNFSGISTKKSINYSGTLINAGICNIFIPEGNGYCVPAMRNAPLIYLTLWLPSLPEL